MCLKAPMSSQNRNYMLKKTTEIQELSPASGVALSQGRKKPRALKAGGAAWTTMLPERKSVSEQNDRENVAERWQMGETW